MNSWFEASWRVRAVRHAVLALPRPAGQAFARVCALLPSDNAALLADDLDGWIAVRATSSRDEWNARTHSSYVALCYHRITTERVADQARMSLPPSVFRRQLGVLRRLGYRPLSPNEVIEFHSGGAPIGRRRYALTADDGFADCVTEMTAAGAAPQLFVPTQAPGGRAWWTSSGAVADWDQLRAAATAGAAIGSHGRRHRPLVDLGDDELRDEIAGSRSDLQEHMPSACTLLAYPNGRYDARVRQAAIDGGYDAAYTTEVGRNAPDTDAWSLRRVTPKAWDSRLSFLFRVVTGEPPPLRWEARRQRAFARRGARAGIRQLSPNALRRRAESAGERRVRTMSPGRRYRSAIVVAELSRRIGSGRGTRLLDAGSEDGIVTTAIAKHRPDWTVVGVDLSRTALRDGANWANDNAATNVHFVRADMTVVLRDAAFDVAIAVDSLTEVPRDDDAIVAIANALRPGGVLVVHTPVAGWKPVLRASREHWPRAVRRGYDADDLVRKCNAAGLVVDEVRPTLRALGHVAQEARDRWVKPRRLFVQLLAFPFLTGAVWLERHGITWGANRALLLVAHRPEEPGAR